MATITPAFRLDGGSTSSGGVVASGRYLATSQDNLSPAIRSGGVVASGRYLGTVLEPCANQAGGAAFRSTGLVIVSGRIIP